MGLAELKKTGIIGETYGIHEMEKPMERKLRKQQSLLVDAGTGVILFGVLGVAKVNLYLGLSPVFQEVLHMIAQEIEMDEKTIITILWFLVAMWLIMEMGVRLYVGLSAIAEGKGKKKGYVYLLVAAALLGTTLSQSWATFGPEALAKSDISMSLILNFCMELISVYVILELLITGIRVKRLKKLLKG